MNSAETTRPKEQVNVKYKDRLFKRIFGTEEGKENALSLYNAVNGTDYQDASQLTFDTLEDVIYMGMKNDVSFLFLNTLNVYEQQSSVNPNMPLRMLLYTAHILESYVKVQKLPFYSPGLVIIPPVKLVVFYNGPDRQNIKDDTYLYLKDAFPEGVESDVQVRARLININSGHNKEMLEKCSALGDYSLLVSLIREYLDNAMLSAVSDSDEAMAMALSFAWKELPDGWVKSYILQNRSEVVDMLLTEYNETEARESVYKAGDAHGKQEMLVSVLTTLMRVDSLTLEQAMDKLEVPEADRVNIRKAFEKQ